MSPEQALQNIYQAAQMASMPARDHILIQESYQLILSTITPEISEPKPKK